MKLIIPAISFVKMNSSGCGGNFPGGCYINRQKVHYQGDACIMSCWLWPSLVIRTNSHRLAAWLWSARWPDVEEAFRLPASAEREVLVFNALYTTSDKVQACHQLHGSCQAVEVLTVPLKETTFQRSVCPHFKTNRSGITEVDQLALYFPTCPSHIEIRQRSETPNLNKKTGFVLTN